MTRYWICKVIVTCHLDLSLYQAVDIVVLIVLLHVNLAKSFIKILLGFKLGFHTVITVFEFSCRLRTESMKMAVSPENLNVQWSDSPVNFQ